MRWFVLLSLVALALARKHYDGYKVVKVRPHDQEQVDFLRHLQHNDVEIDFWEDVPRQGSVTIMVSMIKYVTLTTEFLRREIAYDVINENVEEQVAEEDNRLKTKKVFDINDFNTLADIEGQLATWASNCPSGVSCTRYSIGITAQGRDIYAFRMTTGGNRRVAWFDSTHHAREWLATATNLKIMDFFINSYGNNADATTILNAWDLYFVPVVNPDGYVYTWTNERYWRKNRAPNAGSTCLGVDLNRNYPFRWGREGVSHNPCGDTFCGVDSASEFETNFMMDEISRVSPTFLTSYHSYGYMYLHPYGNTVGHAGFICENPPNYDDVYKMANTTANAVENVFGTRWARGTICRVIYAASGGTIDWAYGGAGVRYAFTPELRGADFVINRNQIEPSFIETMAGIVAMFNEYRP